ncbi:hypothetical protein [Parabacteroides sp.]
MLTMEEKIAIINYRIQKSYDSLLSRLYELRQSGDYDDLYDATEDEVTPFIPKTTEFIHSMEVLLTLGKGSLDH